MPDLRIGFAMMFSIECILLCLDGCAHLLERVLRIAQPQ